MSDQPSFSERLVGGFLAILIVGGLFYGVTFGIFYFTADEVECGTIAGVVPYCSGIYESSTVDQELQVNSSMERFCYQNGERVNCSELEHYEYYQENSYRSIFEEGDSGE